ncbi:MAG TPA: AbrB/MazE/SpoVT family DNA-binding domain-containing protein [Candidatus Paceibacterota bacterium]|jgi:AbrB family looped-hinge helix DNA binding protein
MTKRINVPQFGVTSMGEKGQVVIPADIRTALKFKKGEKLIVMAHEGSVSLIPSAQFAEIAKRFAAVEEISKRSK